MIKAIKEVRRLLRPDFIPLTRYLKNENLDLDNFCFEITHTHLRQCGETSADLAANFKLTNHTAADFQIDQSYGYRRATEIKHDSAGVRI